MAGVYRKVLVRRGSGPTAPSMTMYFSEGICDVTWMSLEKSHWHLKKSGYDTWEVECPSLAKALKAKADNGGFECAAESY